MCFHILWRYDPVFLALDAQIKALAPQGYGFPTALEIPSIASLEVETNDPERPFGAKEYGEGTQLASAPAIINAIYDAIEVRFDSLPVTPEKVLEALKEKQKEESYFSPGVLRIPKLKR